MCRQKYYKWPGCNHTCFAGSIEPCGQAGCLGPKPNDVKWEWATTTCNTCQLAQINNTYNPDRNLNPRELEAKRRKEAEEAAKAKAAEEARKKAEEDAAAAAQAAEAAKQTWPSYQ